MRSDLATAWTRRDKAVVPRSSFGNTSVYHDVGKLSDRHRISKLPPALNLLQGIPERPFSVDLTACNIQPHCPRGQQHQKEVLCYVY